MSNPTVRAAIVALIIANIIWGAASPIFKWSLTNIPPFTLAFWRFAIGALLLGFFLRRRIRIRITTRKDMGLLLLNAISGITLNIMFFFSGLQRTHSINAPVIASAAPILTSVFALLLLHERFSLRKWAGMALGTLGILVIVFEPLLVSGLDGSIIGNLFLILATLGAVGGTITGRSLFQNQEPLAVTFWTILIGALTFLPLACYEFANSPDLYQSLDMRGYTGIVFGSVLSTTAAYTLFNWGLSKITATDTALFTYIDPVVASVVAWVLLREPITVPFLMGSFFIFGGIFIAEGRLHYHPLHRLRGD